MKKLTKIMTSIVLAFGLFACVFSFAGCQGNEKELINIGLSKEIKTEYAINEKIDLNDAKLVLTYNDDSQKEMTISNDMITGFDTTTVGEKTLTISYNAKEIKVAYKVYIKDFDTIMNNVSINFLNESKFYLKAQENVENEWRDSLYDYVKNGRYLKLINGEIEVIYDLINHKSYYKNEVKDSDMKLTDISYYSIINQSSVLQKTSVDFVNNEYRLSYICQVGSSPVQANATISADLRVKEIFLVNIDSVAKGKLIFDYVNVPEITVPNN